MQRERESEGWQGAMASERAGQVQALIERRGRGSRDERQIGEDNESKTKSGGVCPFMKLDLANSFAY